MTSKISISQFGILIFIGSVTFLSVLTSNSINDNVIDSILSAIIACVIGALLSIPMFVNTDSEFLKKIGIVYAVYFIISDIILLAQIENMYSNTIYPAQTTMFLGAMALIVACYGAYKGIETIARSGTIVFAGFVFCMILLICGTAYSICIENYEVLLHNGYNDTVRNTVIIFAKSSFLPQAFILLRFLNKKPSKAFFIWQIISLVAIVLSLSLIMYALGRFAKIQMYPFYTLSSVATLAPIQSMDIIFSYMWLSVICIRLALSLFLSSECLKDFAPKKIRKYMPIALVPIIFLGTFVGIKYNFFEVLVYVNMYLPIVIIILGFIIPLINVIKEKKR